MTGQQLMEWMAYEEVEPFGEQRADLRMAILAALIANINRDPKKKSRAYEPKDFMPRFGERSPGDVAEKVKSYFGMLASNARRGNGS